MVECDTRWGDIHDAEGGELIAVSDGSLRHGTAAFAMVPVQNLRQVSAARLAGNQGIAKAELLGAWAALKAAERSLREDPRVHVRRALG